MIRRRVVPRTENERGAVIVLFTMALIALLVLSAIVVDLGLLRAERRQSQSSADLAALSAGAWLSGHNATTAMSRPRSACEAVLDAARANLENLPSGAAINCSALPLQGVSPSCTGSTTPVTVTATGTAPYTLRVTYPVPSSLISEPAFSGGVGVDDGGQCERMQVTIGYVQDSLFAGVLGIGSVDTEVSAVVRGGVEPGGDRVPALLLLERTGCRVLANSAGGAGNLGIIVGSPSATEGGSIHADTNASGCSGTSTDRAIYGSSLSGGGTSITVANSSGGTQGTISTYATTVGNPYDAAVFPGGISHAATPGDVISRQPVDNRYNPSTRTAITDLHAEARTRVLWSAATATSNGFTVLGCADTNGTWTAAKVFVNCAAWAPQDVRLPNATDLVASGRISVANNRLLFAPIVSRFYIRGCPTCSGGNFFALSVSGSLYVNTGSQAVGAATCDARTGPGAGGTTTNTTRLVMFGSPLDISGTAYLCQTTVYNATDTASYVRQASTSGSPNCSTDRPCPVSGAAPGGTFAVSGYTHWTAPSQTTTAPSATHPLEDLALWSETSSLSEIKSGGVLLSSGVFFSPNARMEFRSPASGLPRDAQWIVRSFELLQGTLKLTPSPSNAVPIPSTGSFGLIR